MISHYEQHLVNRERRYKPQFNYMENQKDLNAKMREILIDWLARIHSKDKVSTKCLFLAVNLLDRYLSLVPISREDLQMIGCVVCSLASKMYDIEEIDTYGWIYYADGSFSAKTLCQAEQKVIQTLEFQLRVPTAWEFLDVYTAKYSPEIQHWAEYMAALCLQRYETMAVDPSVVAAAATWMACRRYQASYQLPPYLSVETVDCMIIDIHIYLNDSENKYRAIHKQYNVSVQ